MVHLKLVITCVLALGTLLRGVDMAVLDVSKFFNVNGNLTLITWAHAVNNNTLLTQALNSSSIMMIEADVVLGNLTGTNLTNIPIMAHPPDTTSSLSLEQFLNRIYAFNVTNVRRKGVKLDFKSIEAFQAALSYLTYWIPQLNCPVWLNSDILSGPQNSTAVAVNATRFFDYSRFFTNVTLSIGWTTNYIQGVNSTVYTNAHITSMLNSLSANNVSQSVTFPVRAFIAARSIPQMQTLVKSVAGSTITVWTSDGDPVNIGELQNLIKTIGVKKTYIDLPDNLRTQLNLGNAAGSQTSVLSLGSLLVLCLLMAIGNTM